MRDDIIISIPISLIFCCKYLICIMVHMKNIKGILSGYIYVLYTQPVAKFHKTKRMVAWLCQNLLTFFSLVILDYLFHSLKF